MPKVIPPGSGWIRQDVRVANSALKSFHLFRSASNIFKKEKLWRKKIRSLYTARRSVGDCQNKEQDCSRNKPSVGQTPRLVRACPVSVADGGGPAGHPHVGTRVTDPRGKHESRPSEASPGPHSRAAGPRNVSAFMWLRRHAGPGEAERAGGGPSTLRRGRAHGDERNEA